jgi:hypothetical protein
MHYIMVMRDTAYWLVGPFASEDTAAEWGAAEVNNPTDDPRWQVLQLAEPDAAPWIVTP